MKENAFSRDEKSSSSEPLKNSDSEQLLSNSESALEAKAERLEEELFELLKDIYKEKFGLNKTETLDLPLELNFQISTNGRPSRWRLNSSLTLYEQLLEALTEISSRADIIQKGRVYCHRCESSLCEHSFPPSSMDVFEGFGSTGVPKWRSFHQVLLDMNDNRIDQLYDESPRLLSLFIPGKELKRKLLHSYGKSSKTYDILGQIISGYIHTEKTKESPERIAFTVQIVESRKSNSETRLSVNFICGVSDELKGQEFFVDVGHHRIWYIMQKLRRTVEQIERRLNESAAARNMKERKKLLSQIPGILRSVIRSLERSGRQSERKTQHSEIRRVQNRPTSKALQEALNAGKEKFFFDTLRKTIIVMGSKNRVHVFNFKGRHITSMNMDHVSLDRRISQKRWRAASEAQIEKLRYSLSEKLKKQNR